MQQLIFNRAVPIKPVDGWYHLTPFGEFPARAELEEGIEEDVLQIVDEEAAQTLIANFTPSRLIDFEHFSHDSEKSSEAAGWMMEIERRDDGIWFKPDWSDSGDAAIAGKRYKFISPVWTFENLGNGRVRPLVLTDAGLTNTPNIKGAKPLFNRQEGPASPNAGEKAQTKKANQSMKPETLAAILAALGLPADASDEQVLQALSALSEKVAKGNEAATLQNRVNELSTQLADVTLDAHGITNNADRDKIRPVLITNREAGVAVLELMKSNAGQGHGSQQRQTLTNRETARTPQGSPEEQAANRKAAKIANRATQLRAADKSLSITAAYRRAEEEIQQEELVAK